MLEIDRSSVTVGRQVQSHHFRKHMSISIHMKMSLAVVQEFLGSHELGRLVGAPALGTVSN